MIASDSNNGGNVYGEPTKRKAQSKEFHVIN